LAQAVLALEHHASLGNTKQSLIFKWW